MRKSFLILVSGLILGVVLPALAGPDFQVIEKARKAKQVAAAERRADMLSSKGSPNCPPPPLVLPLDHGPRALTTQGENRWRKARYEAQLKACKNAPS
ncbi:MAG: hypothetical protein ACT6S0_15955 [Roseateles sp.]|uniref:Uncharacterized protein n=1 Tax=Acidovorax cavernicola TaxID=1675792 RepID=A0A9X8GUQ7_9BURK|nr:hypothetical protein [Acidovorax cavernicola]RIX78913.1 hypothetical protein D3H34_15735 [Acidovorax cavernicola]